MRRANRGGQVQPPSPFKTEQRAWIVLLSQRKIISSSLGNMNEAQWCFLSILNFLPWWIYEYSFLKEKKKSCNEIYVLIQKIKIYYLENVVISNYCYNFWNNLKISREGHIWCLVEWHLLEKWNILCSVLSTGWGGGDGGVHKNHDKLGFYLQNTWKICPIKTSTYYCFLHV